MKALMFTLCLCLVLTGFSQNGGQSPENNALKITYVGKIGNSYFARITSKQDCNAWYKTNFNGNTDDVRISSHGSYLFNMGTQPPGAKVLKVKATTDCGCGDMGWVEFKLISMPLHFKSVTFTRNKDNVNKGILTFETEDVVNVEKFTIRTWLDVNTKVDIGVLLPDGLQPNTTYQFPITDIKALVKRIQSQPKQ